MIKTTVFAFVILILLSPFSCLQASTYKVINSNFADSLNSDCFTSSLSQRIALKKGEKYDESKDPALRKGTENWEQPQSSFWMIPAALVGLVFVVLFFTKQ
jgi:hypothetical protein